MSLKNPPVWYSKDIFLEFVIEIHSHVGMSIGGKEISINDLFDYFEHPNHEISDCIFLEKKLIEKNIEVLPALSKGTNSEQRLFKIKNSSIVNPLEEIKSGESMNQEFKSSLCFDRKRAEYDQNANLPDLNSKDLLYSVLKSIAGFINSDGGLLWLGVVDNARDIVNFPQEDLESNVMKFFPGLVDDFNVLKIKDLKDFDTFELQLRDQVVSWFSSGDYVNNSFEVAFHEIFGSVVCRIKVTSSATF